MKGGEFIRKVHFLAKKLGVPSRVMKSAAKAAM